MGTVTRESLKARVEEILDSIGYKYREVHVDHLGDGKLELGIHLPSASYEFLFDMKRSFGSFTLMGSYIERWVLIDFDRTDWDTEPVDPFTDSNRRAQEDADKAVRESRALRWQSVPDVDIRPLLDKVDLEASLERADTSGMDDEVSLDGALEDPLDD